MTNYKEDENTTLMNNIQIPSQDEIDKVVTELEKDGKPVPAIFYNALIFEDDSSVKPYLLLLKLTSDVDDEDVTSWEVHIGRQDTYEHLRRLIEAEAIIPDESFILSGSTPFEEAITIYRFMKVMVDKNLVVEETGFDIDDYHFTYPDDNKGDRRIVEEE